MYDLAKIDFTENLGNRKIRNFPHRDGQDLHIPNQMQFLSQIALTFESKPYWFEYLHKYFMFWAIYEISKPLRAIVLHN